MTIIEPAIESGLKIRDRILISSKYCIKHEFSLCGKSLKNEGIKEPLYLKDENNRILLVKFDCKKCKMEIFYGNK